MNRFEARIGLESKRGELKLRERDSPSCPRSTARMKSSVRSIVVRWSTIVDPVPPLSSIQYNSSSSSPIFPVRRIRNSTFFFGLDGHDPRSTINTRACTSAPTDRIIEPIIFDIHHLSKTNSCHRDGFLSLSLFSFFLVSKKHHQPLHPSRKQSSRLESSDN